MTFSRSLPALSGSSLAGGRGRFRVPPSAPRGMREEAWPKLSMQRNRAVNHYGPDFVFRHPLRLSVSARVIFPSDANID